MSAPILSVCLITYNHGAYIKQAIESILIQKVNFTWELIIADDFSTDETRELISDYKKKYPDFVKLILQERNVGAAKNFIDLITSPKSKYIAYLEGDDYWTDPNKLQNQVNFLEENPEYSVSFHAAKDLNMDSGNITIHNYKCKNGFRSFTAKDAILKGGGFMMSSSIVFRSEHTRNLPEWFIKSPTSDFPLSLILASHGKVAYFDNAMCVYRRGVPGSWSNRMKAKERIIELDRATGKMLLSFNRYSRNKYVFHILHKILINKLDLIKYNIHYWLKST